MRPTRLALFALALCAAPVGAQQSPGLDFTPPDQAVQLGGGGWGWLNVVDAPLSLQEALTGLPIEAGAIANIAGDAIIEVTFYDGVVNGPGDDLAMLDAQFDLGSYWIESEYDNFVSGIAVDTSNGVVCASVDYYFELNQAGPFSANVVAQTFDLSDLGVPADVTVQRLRFQPLSFGADPIALAKIGASFHLAVTDLAEASTATLRCERATPGALVGLGYSLSGTGPTAMMVPGCGSLSFDLGAPVRTLAVVQADATGAVDFPATVPPGTVGLTIWLQAVDVSSCTLSNLLVRTVS